MKYLHYTFTGWAIESMKFTIKQLCLTWFFSENVWMNMDGARRLKANELIWMNQVVFTRSLVISNTKTRLRAGAAEKSLPEPIWFDFDSFIAGRRNKRKFQLEPSISGRCQQTGLVSEFLLSESSWKPDWKWRRKSIIRG